MIPNYDYNFVFNDKNGDLSARWYITFWVYDVDLYKKVRKFDYSVNSFKSVKERRLYAKKRIETINDLLKRGFHLDKMKYTPK